MLMTLGSGSIVLWMHLLWYARIHRLVEGCCGYCLCEFISFRVLVSVNVLDGEALEKISILLTRAKYFSMVDSLAMHSFSIYSATTLESV
jgi:hypothetical protein